MKPALSPSKPSSIHPKCALISVSDKSGVLDFAKALQEDYDLMLLSTGGTYKHLKEGGLDVIEVSEHTGFPEIMDGRVKTLHPTIHGGILSLRDNDAHEKSMQQHGIRGIDMVITNLYPFIETIKSGGDYATCVENIDIGGPAMIRAAAKNHKFVSVITNPQDYDAVLSDMKEHDGAITYTLRQRLAQKAFALTASYDSAITNWFASQDEENSYPETILNTGTLKQSLRYGENPHQSAAVYRDGSERAGVLASTQHQGKELSYNNINDTDAAFELVSEFDAPTVAIIKHANPCGVATHDNIETAYDLALRCDPVSAFGGIIAVNRPVTTALAEKISKVFTEVIIAPSIENGALDVLKSKKNLRILTTESMADPSQPRRLIKSIAGGFLVQDADSGIVTQDMLEIVTKRKPSPQELEDMLFAFKVGKHVKSNAIIYAKDLATVGIGAGQMSRLDSARIAVSKSEFASKEAGIEETLTKGSVVASDAFFPFADGLIAAAEAGVTAVIQPGGSIRDDEVIAAADERDLAMVFTKMRHFRH